MIHTPIRECNSESLEQPPKLNLKLIEQVEELETTDLASMEDTSYF